MATQEKSGAIETLAAAGRQPFDSLLGFVRSSVLGSFSLILLALLLFIGLFPQAVAPYDPDQLFYVNLKQPPSWDHWAGTDFIARDSLTRIIYGARMTLLVAFVSVFIGDAVGFAWGVMSGYLGGKFDMVSQRMVDMFIAFPTIILALLLLAALGAGLGHHHTGNRGHQDSGNGQGHQVCRAFHPVHPVRGSRRSGGRVPVENHGAPHSPPVLRAAVRGGERGAWLRHLHRGRAELPGHGRSAPTPTWGNMLGGVLNELFQPPWWLVIFPGVAITITILAFNLLGDALRDYLDPRLRGHLN